LVESRVDGGDHHIAPREMPWTFVIRGASCDGVADFLGFGHGHFLSGAAISVALSDKRH
jgi:hypothetical protein